MGRVIAVLVTIASLIGSGWYYYHQRTTSPATTMIAPGDYISKSQLAERYGLQITRIGVTAAGGIIDLRYKILDAVKASPLLSDPTTLLTLVAVDSGLTLNPARMGRSHDRIRMKNGAVPFNFYPNARGAVKPGTLVSVAFGKIKVEPIAAQ